MPARNDDNRYYNDNHKKHNNFETYKPYDCSIRKDYDD